MIAVHFIIRLRISDDTHWQELIDLASSNTRYTYKHCKDVPGSSFENATVVPRTAFAIAHGERSVDQHMGNTGSVGSR